MALGRAHSLDSALVRTSDIRINENVDFRSLLLSEPVLQGLAQAGFVRPSPIQLKAIPIGRYGLDLIVQAKSGTGKTCVFAVIALENVILECQNVQVLILAPTREIAVQISQVILSVGACMAKLKCSAFIGGTPFSKDKFKLRQCHIAVGTPGRIKQLIEEGFLRTESIRLFVLDEADKLIAEGFQETINWIYSCLPESKQMLALSATYPESLAQLLTQYMKSPTFVRLNVTDPSLLGVKQYYCITPLRALPQKTFDAKVDILIQILNGLSFNQCLVFSNFQAKAQMLASLLTSHGWPTMYLAGSQAQHQRLLAMASLQQYHCRILVSTDLSARGIDAENVNVVVNMDVPMEADTYLHRIGRAGRFGTVAIAVTIATEGKEAEALFSIRNAAHLNMTLLPDKIDGSMWKAEELVVVAEDVNENADVSSNIHTSKESTPEKNGVKQEAASAAELCAGCSARPDDTPDDQEMQEKDSGNSSDEEANIIEIPAEIDEESKIGDYLTVIDACKNEVNHEVDGTIVVDSSSPIVMSDLIAEDPSNVQNLNDFPVILGSEMNCKHNIEDSISEFNLMGFQTEAELKANNCEKLKSFSDKFNDKDTNVELKENKLFAGVSSDSEQSNDTCRQLEVLAGDIIVDENDDTCESTRLVEEIATVEIIQSENFTVSKDMTTNELPKRSKMLRHENKISSKSDDTEPATNEKTPEKIDSECSLAEILNSTTDACDENSSVNVHNVDNFEAFSDKSSQRSSLTLSSVLAEGELENELCSSDHTKDQIIQLDHDKALESLKAILPQLFQCTESPAIPKICYNELVQDITEFLKKSNLADKKPVEEDDKKVENVSLQESSETPEMPQQIPIPCCIHSYMEWVLLNKKKYLLSDDVVKALNEFLQKRELLTSTTASIIESSKNEDPCESTDVKLEYPTITERNIDTSDDKFNNEAKDVTEQCSESSNTTELATEIFQKPELQTNLLSFILESSKNEDPREDNDTELKNPTICEKNVETSNDKADNETKDITKLHSESSDETEVTTANTTSKPMSESNQTEINVDLTGRVLHTPESVEDYATAEDMPEPSDDGTYRLPNLAELDKQLTQQDSISLVESFLAEINNNNSANKQWNQSVGLHKLEKAASDANDNGTSGNFDNKSSQASAVTVEQLSCNIPEPPITGAKPKITQVNPVSDNTTSESSDNEMSSTTTEESMASEVSMTDSAKECDSTADNPLKNYFNWLNLGQKANAQFETDSVGHKTKDKSSACHHEMGDGWWHTMGSPLPMPPPPPPPNCACIMNQYYFWNMYFMQYMKPCNACACCTYWNRHNPKLQAKKPSSKHPNHK